MIGRLDHRLRHRNGLGDRIVGMIWDWTIDWMIGRFDERVGEFRGPMFEHPLTRFVETVKFWLKPISFLIARDPSINALGRSRPLHIDLSFHISAHHDESSQVASPMQKRFPCKVVGEKSTQKGDSVTSHTFRRQ